MAPKTPAEQYEEPVSFQRPPVDEVYIAMQTKEAAFPSDNFGELIEIYGTDLPKLNAQPKLDRDSEREEVAPAALQIELMQNLGQRFWLISQDDTRVLQVQSDRIVYNWRKMASSTYPRFRSIRDEFTAALDKLVSAKGLNAEDLIDFCEVSYTNHIEMPDGTDPRSQLHRIFTYVKPIEVTHDHLVLEESAVNLALRINDKEGRFLGRMRFTAQPAIRRDTKQFVLKTVLTYRGKPESPSVKSALSFCDAGHLAIVTTFKKMTTREMHEFWGET